MAKLFWDLRLRIALLALGVAAIGVGVSAEPASAQRLTAEAAARQVAETYGVEALRVREMRQQDGSLAYAVTVMVPGGDSNNAFTVTTLLVDAQTGDLIPQFRHTPTGHEFSDAPSNVPPTESDGPALRRGFTRP